MLKTVFIISNSISILANCVDFAYYKFTLKHTTSDFFSLFSLGSDIGTMLPQYIRDFWYIIFIWIALTVFMGWMYGKINAHPPTPSRREVELSLKGSCARNLRLSFGKDLGWALVSWFVLNSILIGLCIIGFRGGFQLRPIATINASEYVSAQNIPLIINTPFSIVKSYGLEELEERNYFSGNERTTIFNPIHRESKIQNLKPRSNVFIIIMESFSKEYIGALSGRKSYTPFLDSLIKESLVFNNAFANGKRSIEGIPAVLASIPSLMNESYITSSYGSNKFSSLATTLKDKGYSSAFFHGGTNGTMGFDVFTKAAGFDKYFGRYEYNNEKDYDGDWGIGDEKFFQYTGKEVSKMKNPFLVTLFSISSHHPFAVPAEYAKQFQEEGGQPIYKSVRYADFSLKRFFESIEKENWFDSTLFVITADHAGPSVDNFYSNNVGSFEIPILFYKHNSSLKRVDPRTTQHIDIMPSILSYLHYNEEYFSMGENMLDSTSSGYAVNFINDVYQIFQDDYLLQFDGHKTLAVYDYKTDSLLQQNLRGKLPEREKSMEVKLKAIIQTFNHSLIHNKMTAKSE